MEASMPLARQVAKLQVVEPIQVGSLQIRLNSCATNY